jgi:hypothetical protein
MISGKQKIKEKWKSLKSEQTPEQARSFWESREKYIALAKIAGIPKKFQLDLAWKNLNPEPIHILEPVKRSKPIHITPKTQKSWLRRCVKYNHFRKIGCVVIFGDYMAEAAERVAYGLLGSAIRRGFTGKAFHPLDVKNGPPIDAGGDIIPYDVVLLNRIHSDDEGPRRSMVRDFVNKHYLTSFKILVVYGDEPIDFFYKKIGLNPQAIFHFPYQGQKLMADFAEDLETEEVQEH